MNSSLILVHCLVAACAIVLAACSGQDSEGPPAESEQRWCDLLPRAANQEFEKVKVDSDWFQVYHVEKGVFALVEPFQFQETISYLILGDEQALLFDTGLGMSPIKPIVEQLTSLPIRVLNSHTHYDHVGGNADFETILAVDSPYTRANQRGFPHSELTGEVAAQSFCDGPPEGLDTSEFHTRTWAPTLSIRDGDQIDLGGRILKVLQVPGHTPDALALLDEENELLWTGDTYYDATIWLYVPETDLDAYQESIDRLTAMTSSLRRLLPAHNTVTSDPSQLAAASRAIRQIRAGSVQGASLSDNQVLFRFQHFSILTSRPLLEGKSGDPTRGGSGLSTWP